MDSLSALFINLTPSVIDTVSGGVILYKIDNVGWNEKLNENNIGLIDFGNFTPLDTIFSVQENVELSINIKPFIIQGGLHSFALGGVNSSDHISFYSKENLTLGGDFNNAVPDHNSGYATNYNVWPSISFLLEENLSVDNKLLPNAFALHQNYPNPFNPKTVIRYDLPKETTVKILIYDMLGRLVTTLADNKHNAGFKQVHWDATNGFGKKVSAGLYLYTIQAGAFRQTKKMVLLK